MGSLFRFKNLMYIFVLASFYAHNALHAELLLFKAGDKASYTISQNLTAEGKIFGATTYSQSDATIDIDIEILSSNQETLSYPFDVEVTLRKILISEIQHDGTSSTIIKYDSNGLKSLENVILAKHLDKLINIPLNFRIEDEFKVKETTGYLTKNYEEYDSPSTMGLFGTTSWSFELLLTQLFQLSGENLQLSNSYPTSCYQFLNWEDEALEIQEINFAQSSAYTVNAHDSKNIEASWSGQAVVNSVEDSVIGGVIVSGNVSWDIANPLIQKRDLEVKLEAHHYGFIQADVELTARQTWQPY